MPRDVINAVRSENKCIREITIKVKIKNRNQGNNVTNKM